MRMVYSRPVTKFSLVSNKLESSPVEADSQNGNLVGLQRTENNEPFEIRLPLEEHEPGLYELSINEMPEGGQHRTLTLSFATIHTPFGFIGSIGADPEDARRSLESSLLLAQSGGSGIELATGHPVYTQAAIHALSELNEPAHSL